MQGFDAAFIDHIAGHDREFGPARLHTLDRFHHTHRVAVRGVDHDRIYSDSRECLDTRLQIFTDTDGRRDTQASARITSGVRELLTLHDVFHGDEAAQPSLCIDERKFLDAVLLQQLLGLLERRALRCGHETLTRHEVADGPLVVVGRAEAHVAVGEDSDQHAVTVGDRHARNLEAVHQLLGIVERGGRRQRDRVGDHARLRALHLLHFCRLVFDGEIAMHHAEAAATRHGDREARLGHAVHRGRHERHAEHDVAREGGGGVDLVGQHVAEAGHQHHVVEREALEAVEELLVVVHD